MLLDGKVCLSLLYLSISAASVEIALGWCDSCPDATKAVQYFSHHAVDYHTYEASQT